MTRADAYEILKALVKNQNLIKHHLACEVIMGSLCKTLNPQADDALISKWRLVGLLHDADYEITKNNPEKHTLVLEERIGNRLEKDVMYAIKAHNFNYTKVEPKSSMDWAMYCCDELSGIIVAATLVHPDKRLTPLTLDFVKNRLDDKTFAKGASRAQIKLCETKLHIPLDQFIRTCLISMQTISPQLSL